VARLREFLTTAKIVSGVWGGGVVSYTPRLLGARGKTPGFPLIGEAEWAQGRSERDGCPVRRHCLPFPPCFSFLSASCSQAPFSYVIPIERGTVSYSYERTRHLIIA
jgi:hypothetical protein